MTITEQQERAKAELMHYGVVGMRWGAHRSISKVGRDGKSERTRRIEGKLKTATKERKAADKEAKKHAVAKAKSFVKLYKESGLEIAQIKSKYRDDYNKGKNLAQRVLTTITGSDKTYAQLMYDMNDA